MRIEEAAWTVEDVFLDCRAMTSGVRHEDSLISSAPKYASKGFTAPENIILNIFSRADLMRGTVLKQEFARTMMSDRTNLEALAHGPTRRQAIISVAMAFGGLALGSTEAGAGAEDEISRTAESIHQEVSFKASRKRVYEALTDTKQFDKAIRFSAAMKSMTPGGKPTEISSEEGGAFALFGGYI